MKKYKTLIFDLDDTLIDNNKSVKYAFKVIVNKLGFNFNEELYKKWLTFDKEYWHLWESGQMPIPNNMEALDNRITYVRANRFIIFFKNLSLEEAIIINDLYCKMLGVNIVEIEGAKALLEKLYPNYEIAIATNGPKMAAIRKLKKIKVYSFVSLIVASEEVGFSKPSHQYFDYLCNKTINRDKDKMLLIGDTLSTDILGGMNNGIDTCWFNPNNNLNSEEYKPTITINKLLQLKKKL